MPVRPAAGFADGKCSEGALCQRFNEKPRIFLNDYLTAGCRFFSSEYLLVGHFALYWFHWVSEWCPLYSAGDVHVEIASGTGSFSVRFGSQAAQDAPKSSSAVIPARRARRNQ